jgi:predicted dehydrogenase
MRKVRVGVVGLGYWGPNLARTFAALPGAQLEWLCDQDETIRKEMAQKYPATRLTSEFDDLLNDSMLDAIVIATPAVTHSDLVARALGAGKHVFVEKPLALRGEDAFELAAMAANRGKLLMTGHVLLFHPAVAKMKELIETGQLGRVFYLYCNRQNLGKVRHDENALWSLAPHDVSVLLYLLDGGPVEVSARGESYLRSGVDDVVFCYLRFPTGVVAHLHLSWLDPQKLRRLTVVGSEKMAVFDDMEVERKLTIYDKAAVPPRTDAFGEYVQVRFGDIHCPRLPPAEPLRLECEHFLAAIRSSSELSVGTGAAVETVGVLEALQRSLELDGSPVQVEASRWRRLRLAASS